MKGIAAPALPFGCFATLRSLSHCFQLIRHSSQQLLCPSCHLIHIVLVPLHYTTFVRVYLLQWHGTLPLITKQSTSDAHTFSQTHATILPGFHSATLRPTFISVAFSPVAANNSFNLRHSTLLSSNLIILHELNLVPYNSFIISFAKFLTVFLKARSIAFVNFGSPTVL